MLRSTIYIISYISALEYSLTLFDLTKKRIWAWLKIKELGQTAGFSLQFIYQGAMLVYLFERQPYLVSAPEYTVPLFDLTKKGNPIRQDVAWSPVRQPLRANPHEAPIGLEARA